MEGHLSRQAWLADQVTGATRQVDPTVNKKKPKNRGKRAWRSKGPDYQQRPAGGDCGSRGNLLHHYPPGANLERDCGSHSLHRTPHGPNTEERAFGSKPLFRDPLRTATVGERESGSNTLHRDRSKPASTGEERGSEGNLLPRETHRLQSGGSAGHNRGRGQGSSSRGVPQNRGRGYAARGGFFSRKRQETSQPSSLQSSQHVLERKVEELERENKSLSSRLAAVEATPRQSGPDLDPVLKGLKALTKQVGKLASSVEEIRARPVPDPAESKSHKSYKLLKEIKKLLTSNLLVGDLDGDLAEYLHEDPSPNPVEALPEEDSIMDTSSGVEPQYQVDTILDGRVYRMEGDLGGAGKWEETKPGPSSA